MKTSAFGKTIVSNTVLWISLFIIVLSNPLLSGCASNKKQVFGESMPTIKQVYQKKFGQAKDSKETETQRAVRPGSSDLSTSLRTIYDDLHEQFPTLPNPTLLLYVYPHLTAAGTPVPGYYTVFKMYEKDEYALPGEIKR